MKSKLKMVKMSEEHYEAANGTTLKREYGLTPNGNEMNGRWVLRGPDSELIDFDQYRNDIAECHNLKLVSDDGED